MAHRIGIIGGDGIGPEVVAEALKVVDAAGVEYEPVAFDLGGARVPARRRGAPRRRPRVASWVSTPCSSAPWGRPTCRPGVIERGLLLRLRFELDLYVNCRPFAAGPSALNDGVDMIVIRENTEGTYAGEGGFLRKGTPHEVATQGSVNTRIGVERCIRYAFDWLRRASAGTSRSSTRRTCSRSPAICGSARSDEVAAEYPRHRRPRTTTSTPRASTSSRTRAATT